MKTKETAACIAKAIIAYWQVKCEVMDKHPLSWLSGDHEKAAQYAYFKSLGYRVRMKK